MDKRDLLKGCQQESNNEFVIRLDWLGYEKKTRFYSYLGKPKVMLVETKESRWSFKTASRTGKTDTGEGEGKKDSGF